jgi:hypothetical protein
MSNAGTTLQRRQGPEAQTHKIDRPIHPTHPLIKEGHQMIYTSPEGILSMRQANTVDGGRVEDPRRYIQPLFIQPEISTRSDPSDHAEISTRSDPSDHAEISTRSDPSDHAEISTRSDPSDHAEISTRSKNLVVYVIYGPLGCGGRATTAYLLSRLVPVGWS